MTSSPSEYVCDRCELPLQETGSGFRHAANAATKSRSCGLSPTPRRRDTLLLRPGTPVTVWRPAGVITVNGRPFRQRLRPAAFEGLHGREITLFRNGVARGQLALRHAEVAGDGSSVTLSYEVLEREGAA